MGRPSKYSPELIEAICARLSQGEPLAQICRDDGMPDPSTIWDWQQSKPDVSQAIARAREAGFDQIALDALRIADYGAEDKIVDEDGNERPNHELIQRSKLRVETRLKLLAKWDPKRYGDRVELAHSGELKTTPDDQLESRLAQLIAEAGVAGAAGGKGEAEADP